MHAGYIAYDWFKEAMGHFEKAAEVRPAGNDGAILRWNTCARILMATRAWCRRRKRRRIPGWSRESGSRASA